MRTHLLFLTASILLFVGCAGHGSQPVTPAGQSPQKPVAVAKANPNPQAINLPVSFSGSDSHDPGSEDIKLFEWDWDNDGTYDETGENVDHTWSELGTFHVQLRVTNDENQTDMLDQPLSVVITMMNPVAVAKADLNPHAINIPVSFSGSDSYDPDGGEIQLFEWDWNNDGIYDETGENIDHTWNEIGTFYVQLRVTDDESQVDILDEPLQVVVSDTGDGGLIWAKDTNGSSGQCGYGITTLSDNSTVAIGLFGGFATFGPGEPNATQLESTGEADIFVSRYNADGSLIWAKRAGGPLSDYGRGITTLSDDSTVVTGYFYNTVIFGQGEANETQLVSSGNLDIFVARYFADGSLAWAINAGGSSIDEGYGITSLSDDSTVVTGDFYGTATFGSGESNETQLTGTADIFIARYYADGSLAWAKCAGGPTYDYGHGITSLSDDSTVVTGYFDETATFGNGETNETQLVSDDDSSDIFIARYNADGSLAWAKRAGGYSSDEGNGITTLSDNSIVVTGFFNETATFGAGETNETKLFSANATDIFIARFNPNGSLAWAKRACGPHSDLGSEITSLSDDSTVLTGLFSETVTFGLGDPLETQLVSVGEWDFFIARYNDDGNLAWAKCAGDTDYDVGYGITTLSDNSTVVTGRYEGTVIFGLGDQYETELNSGLNSEVFVARYEP